MSMGASPKSSKRAAVNLLRSQFGSLVGGVLAVLAGLLFCNQFTGQTLIQRSYDLPFALRSSGWRSDMIIVQMNEESHEELGLSWNRPWDRNLHAELLDRLRLEGSRTVVFDVQFAADPERAHGTNRTPDQATQRLAEAMRRHGRVVIACHVRRIGRQGLASGTSLEMPESVLAQAAAGVGVAEMEDDTDTTVRVLRTSVPAAGRSPLPTLGWEAARVEGASVVRAGAPRLGEGWLNYYGPPHTVETISYHEALRGSAPGRFRDKIVLVGASYQVAVMGARADTFRNPFPTGNVRFDGIELHATALANLMQGEWLRRPSAGIEVVLVILLGALVGGGLPRLSPRWAAAAALALMLGGTLLAIQLHGRARIWFPWLIPVLIQFPVAWIWSLLFHAIQGYMHTALLERSLACYLSPKQVQNLLHRPELLARGGRQQLVSILFSDIANFSKFSERMDPESLVELLNRYYDEAIARVHETDGTVVKLIGDSIFALWNAPHPQMDHQGRACRAALLLHAGVVRLSSQPGTPPLRTRIGLHTGNACVGNVGSADRFDYTAIGEAVNLASRLESLNKILGTSILASRDVLKGLEDRISSRCLGYFRLKGFDGVVEVHEILDETETKKHAALWLSCFERALHHFQRGDFDQAKCHFQATLQARPGDGPAQFYLDHLAERPAGVAPSDWTGEVNIREK
jgi:adenylate cyclase